MADVTALPITDRQFRIVAELDAGITRLQESRQLVLATLIAGSPLERAKPLGVVGQNGAFVLIAQLPEQAVTEG